MKTIELNIPDSIYQKLENLASQDHQSVKVFASRKLEEFARAVEDFKELERHAARASDKGISEFLAQVPNVPPVPGDDLLG
jgi:hypothetical protein